MHSILISKLTGLRDIWEQEAANRRARTPSDPAAETLASCARDVEATLAAIDEAMASLSPAQYAELHHVTPQTVTRWIRVGELAAEETPHGYRIAVTATRIPRIGTPLRRAYRGASTSVTSTRRAS